MTEAETSLIHGNNFPYDKRPASDNAHKAALGVLANLLDRRGIKQELEKVDDEIRAEIVDSVASIIRTAMKD